MPEPGTDRILTAVEALRLLLDHVDYVAGVCAATERVDAILPVTILDACNHSLALAKVQELHRADDVAKAGSSLA